MHVRTDRITVSMSTLQMNDRRCDLVTLNRHTTALWC